MKDQKESYYLAKWLAGEMSAEEENDFKKSNEYAIYEKIKQATSNMSTPEFEQEKMYQNIVVATKSKQKTIPLYKQNWVKIAAVFVLFFAISFGVFATKKHTELAQNGEKTIFSLPDNSEVVLNAGSTIEYKKWNWNNNRTLNLEGEAFFKVAKGKKFEVKTNLGNVIVLGTQFNVKQRENRFEIKCYEGKVKIISKNNEKIITKGMKITFENDTFFESTRFNGKTPEWLNDELSFDKTSLKEVVNEIERNFNITIDLKNITNNELFTGTIPAKNCDQVIDIISRTYHLKMTKLSKKAYQLTALNAQK